MGNQSEAKETGIRFLVTDYDHCAVRPDSERPDLLSTSLINHALDPQANYKGFYGCTHRSSMTAYFVKYPSYNPSIKRQFAKHEDKFKNLSTSSITDNFAKATKLCCQEVSMLNDIFIGEDACGSMFKNTIKPYEASNRKFRCDFITTLPKVAKAHFGNKNYQLLQIAQHAAENYPDVAITLDFVDDKLKLCEQAIDAPKQFKSHWPTNVKLNVFHHKTKEDIVPVTSNASTQPASYLSRAGFFAATATLVSGAVALYSLCKRSFTASAA